jgi:hypothetical protein
VERPSLVDVHQAPLQHRTPLGQIILRQYQLRAGPVELGGQPADLPLDLVYDSVSRFPLPLQVTQLVVYVMHLPLQSLPLALQPIPLGADLL